MKGIILAGGAEQDCIRLQNPFPSKLYRFMTQADDLLSVIHADVGRYTRDTYHFNSKGY